MTTAENLPPIDTEFRDYVRKQMDRSLAILICTRFPMGGGVMMSFGTPPPEIDTPDKAFDWIEERMWSVPTSSSSASPPRSIRSPD